MMDQGIKSRPSYRLLRLDRTGCRHLLVCDRAELPASALEPGEATDAFDGCWFVAGTSRAIPSPEKSAADNRFRSASHLLIALRHRLAEETMGFRLYAAGSEVFVWDVFGIAQGAGMSRTELFLHAVSGGPRRVYCYHCRTIDSGVRTNIVRCSGCGANLFVRDHFSRRLNAFAGVQVDAEVPGEIPAIEEIYT